MRVHLHLSLVTSARERICLSQIPWLVGDAVATPPDLVDYYTEGLVRAAAAAPTSLVISGHPLRVNASAALLCACRAPFRRFGISFTFHARLDLNQASMGACYGASTLSRPRIGARRC